MEIDPGGLDNAIDSLSSAVALGQSWRPSLEMMCSAMGARSGAVGRTTATQLHVVATPALDEPIADLRAGRTPPYSSEIFLDSAAAEGFVSDSEPRFRQVLWRTPFFRDYMLPVLDIPHRASAALERENAPSALRIAFWRAAGQGAFSLDERARLNALLPALRIAARFSERLLQQKAQERSQFYRSRGGRVFQLDFLGRPVGEESDAVLAEGGVLRLLRGRLACARASEQRRLDAVIAQALPGSRRHGAVALTRPGDGQRVFLLAMPIVGEASEVFGPVSALCVLIDPSQPSDANPVAIENLAMATGLTPREAEIAAQIAAGLSPAEAARRLGVVEGTVRSHLKAVMHKCAVHSQTELAALIGRFA